MEYLFKCPECNNSDNIHYNYDYSKAERPVKNIVCNQCGVFFIGGVTADTLLTKPGFVERRMAQGKAINDKMWDSIYNEYKGVSDLHDFVDWLKANYIVPEPIYK